MISGRPRQTHTLATIYRHLTGLKEKLKSEVEKQHREQQKTGRLADGLRRYREWIGEPKAESLPPAVAPEEFEQYLSVSSIGEAERTIQRWSSAPRFWKRC